MELTDMLHGRRELIQFSPDRHYLVGEIAEKLYAYEQLGYSPEELRDIIALEHCLKHDIGPISSLFPSMMIVPRTPVPEIKKVIFNNPATIVLWADGTKTIVKATNEEFDPEKGLAMAITKKALGNKGNYFETIKKWTKEYKTPNDEANINMSFIPSVAEGCAKAVSSLKKLSDALTKKVEEKSAIEYKSEV